MDRTIFWIIAVATVCILAVFSLPLFNGTVYTFDDFIYFHLPYHKFYARALSEGADFTWCPDVFCGFDLHAEGQVGMYHPLHLLLYRFLPFSAAFNLELFLSYPFLFIGMYFLLRRWNFSSGVCMFGAFTFTFNSFMFLRFQHMHMIATIAHLPWTLLCCDVILRGGSRGKVQVSCIMLAILTASQILLGFPQSYWMTAMIEAVYVLILAISRRVYFPLLKVFGFKLLGVLMASVQLIPTMTAIYSTARPIQDLNYQGEYSFHPINFLLSVSPYYFKEPIVPFNCVWEGTMYSGVIAIVLCIWLATRKEDLLKNRVILAIALVLTVVGTLLALGRYLPIFPLLMKVPPFGMFRCPDRYDLLVHFGLSAAAACALACLLQAQRKSGPLSKSVRVFILIVLAVAVLPLLYNIWVSRNPQHPLAANINSPYMAAIGSAILAAGAALVIAALKGFRWAVLAIVLLQVTDLGIYCESYVLRQGQAMSLADLIAAIRTPQEVTRGELVYTITDNILLLKGFRLFVDLVALPPHKELISYKIITLHVAGVNWIRKITGPNNEQKWTRVPDPLPRVQLYQRAMVYDDLNSQINQIDCKTTALVSKEISLSGESLGTVSILKDAPGDIEIAADVNSRQLLFLSESFNPGWRVEVNGKRREVIRVFGDFMGCVLDAGSRNVRFLWNPADLMIGKSISLILAAAMLIWLLVLGARNLPSLYLTRRFREAGHT